MEKEYISIVPRVKTVLEINNEETNINFRSEFLIFTKLSVN